MNITGMFDKN